MAPSHRGPCLSIQPITVSGIWPVFNIVLRFLGGFRPPDPPGWAEGTAVEMTMTQSATNYYN